MPTRIARGSLSTKLLTGACACLLFLSVPIYGVGKQLLYGHAEEKAGEALGSLARQSGALIGQQLNDRLHNVVNKVQQDGLFEGGRDHKRAEQIRLMQSNHPEFLWIGFTDAEGVVTESINGLLKGKNVSARPWFKLGQKAPVVMDKHEATLLSSLLPADKGPYQFVDFAAPLTPDAQGNPTGVLGIHIDWRWVIERLQAQGATFGQHQYLMVLGSDGSVRYNGLPSDGLSAVHLEHWTDSDAFKQPVDSPRWSLNESDFSEPVLLGVSSLVGDNAVKRLGWRVVTVMPLKQLDATVTPFILYAVFALMTGVSVTLLMVYVCTKELSRQTIAHIDSVEADQPGKIRETLAHLPKEFRAVASHIHSMRLRAKERMDELESMIATAREHNWMIESLIDQAPLPIAMFDMQMRYVASSARWRDAYLKGIEHYRGQCHYDLLPDIPEEWKAQHQRCLNGERVARQFDRWKRTDGTCMYLNWALEPWFMLDGTQGGVIIMADDVSHVYETEQRLIKSEERFAMAMQGSRDGLWDWDLLTDQIYYSPSWMSMVGYEPEELESTLATWERIVHPDDLPTTMAAVQAAWEDQTAFHFSTEFRLKHKLGHWVEVFSRGLIVRNENGTPIRMVGTHIDMTNQRSLERKVAEARVQVEAARESNLAKGRFLATISHEIRTPLNGVIGFSKLLARDLPDGENREYAQHLVQTSESLAVILNDLMDFSKIEAGMLHIESAPFLLSQLVDSSIALHKVACMQKGIEFQLSALTDLDQWLVGDMGRLRQVLHNLLSNAVKFTEAGTVTLEVSAIDISEQGKVVNFAVSDTGRGMSADSLGRLFTPFTQVHSDPARSLGGTGLGLSIVKAIVQAMDGRVSVESSVGKGSRFVVSVPMQCMRKSGLPIEQAVGDAGALHILVADDTPLNVKLLRRFLEKNGHSVASAFDGEQALEMCQREVFDFIILDIDMPGLNGYEVAQAVRTGQGPNRRTVIAALTGHAFEQDIETAKASGIDHHFSKPIQFELLLNRLAEVAGHRGVLQPSALS